MLTDFLGSKLVAWHGFDWVSLGPGRLGVIHPALASPIDLTDLETGQWCEEPPESPARGERTHASLPGLIRAVRIRRHPCPEPKAPPMS
jgi:hypothetical protein